MVEILGIPFSTMTFEETVSKLAQAMQQGTGAAPLHIITAGPELIMMARKNDVLMNLLQTADVVTPDGIGAVWASKFYGEKITDRVTGAELSSALIEFAAHSGLRVYLLGAKPDTNRLALQNLRRQYPKLQVEGRDGYFSKQEEAKIVREIAAFKPHLVLVGLGQPRQEAFISDHKKEIDARVLIGVGGCIDIFAGTVKRAPKLFQDLRLEWFYRLVSQPSRFKRQLELPKFVLTVMNDKNRKR